MLTKQEHQGNLVEINQVQGEINRLLEMEDIRWRQRAKRNWYAHGDRNTQYFHTWANQRRRQNYIGSIKDDDGRVWSEQEGIGRAFSMYYQKLLTSSGRDDTVVCLAAVQARVPPHMMELLTTTLTYEEVDQALGQMHPLKSSGSNGF